jgi:hypothetical protein
VPTNRLIPIEEIKKLTRGSYEHVIAVVEQVVQENAEGIFGKQVGVRLLGTFPGLAIALSEDGDIARISFESTGNGSIRITKHEAVDVPQVDPNKVDDFVRSEVSRAVAEWQAGRVGAAQKIIASVAPYVGERPLMDDRDVVGKLISSFEADRPWKKLFRERSDHFRKLIGAEALASIDNSRAARKFSTLYDGSISEDQMARYHSLVRSNLAYLSSRVESLRDLVESSYGSLRSVIRSDDLEDVSVSTLALFAEDLVSDLRRLYTVLTESAKKLTETGSLGRLHDIVAEGLHEYEIAGRFVSTMARRICEAST